MAGAADGRVRVYPVPGKGTLAPHPSIHPDAPSGQYHLAARQLGVVASCPLLNPYARNAVFELRSETLLLIPRYYLLSFFIAAISDSQIPVWPVRRALVFSHDPAFLLIPSPQPTPVGLQVRSDYTSFAYTNPLRES
uniref:Hira domain-containing protein n=1 Tax=Mesocestoides corti TaxID=53468 RepID=A0A5K3EQG2_MESCO